MPNQLKQLFFSSCFIPFKTKDKCKQYYYCNLATRSIFRADCQCHEPANYMKTIQGTLKNTFKRKPINTRQQSPIKRFCQRQRNI